MYDAVYCSARPLDSPGGRETEGENSRDRQARRSYLAEEASEGQYRRSATVHTSRPERDVASAWGGQRGSYRSRESLSRVASEFRSFGGRPTTDQPADSRSYWKNSSHYSSSGLRGHSTPSPRHVNGSTHTSRPEHSSKKPPQPLAVDWADVERRARENGFIVPGDIVEEFKRQGHFDALRRSLLSTFQSSPLKAELLDKVSTLLLSHIASKTLLSGRNYNGERRSVSTAATLDALGDVRLQHAELIKFLDKDGDVASDDESDAGPLHAKQAGPRIFKNLMQTLEQPWEVKAKLDDTKPGTAANNGDQNDSNDLRSVLSPHGSIGCQVTERVSALLGEERSHKRTKCDRVVDEEKVDCEITCHAGEEVSKNVQDDTHDAVQRESEVSPASIEIERGEGDEDVDMDMDSNDGSTQELDEKRQRP